MKAPRTLDLLRSLAARKTEQAASVLATSAASQQDASARLQMLDQLGSEYRDKLATTLTSGTGIAQWQNFHQFMLKVDRAVAGQQQIVSQAEARSLRARHAWQQQKQREQSFDTLIQRANLIEEQQQQKREQKAMDEFAANSTRQRQERS